jgi:hypothetical protein
MPSISLRLLGLFSATLLLGARSAAGFDLPATACPGGTYPCMTVTLSAPGNATAYEANSSGVTQTVSGLGLTSSGASFGFATIGSLGSRSTITGTGPTGDVGSALSIFNDAFLVNNSSLFNGFLQITFALNGTLATSGTGTGRVSAILSLFNAENAAASSSSLSGPGSISVAVLLLPGANRVEVEGSLSTFVETTGIGGADVDFVHTLTIQSVQLLDFAHRSLGDLALVDMAGNPLPIYAPEPSTGLLLLSVSAGLSLARRHLAA